MRSIIAIAALVLSGSLGSASASRCHPGTTPSTRTVKNLVVNGNLQLAAPGPGEIYAFGVSGEGNQNTVNGYTGNGATGTGCGQLTAIGPTPDRRRKREVGATAGIDQGLIDLASGTAYTVQFFYFVASSNAANTCWIEGIFGNEEPFITSDFLSVTSQWVRVVQSVSIGASTANFRFLLTCTNGGMSIIYIDQIFISNQVTPANIDSFIIDYDAAQLPGGESSVPVPTETAATGVVTPVHPATSSASDLGPDPITPGHDGESTPVPSTTIPSTSTTTSGCPAGVAAPGACYDATPTAEGSWCYKRAFIDGPNTCTVSRDLYPDQSRAEKCAFICQLDPNCKAFVWDYSVGPSQCKFSTVVLAEAGLVEFANAPNRWFDIGCYTCFNCPASSSAASSTVATTTPAGENSVSASTTPTGEVKPPIPSCTVALEQGCSLFDDYYTGNVAYTDCYNRGRFDSTFLVDKDWYPWQTSWTQCQAVCANMPNRCGSSAYDQASDRCLFSTHSITDLEFEVGNGQGYLDWTDASCVACPTCTEQVRSTSTAPSYPTRTCSFVHGEVCERNTDIGDSLVCGRVGWLQGGGYEVSKTDYPYQESEEQCAALCSKEPLCESSGFNPVNKQCYWMNGNLDGARFSTMNDPEWHSIWSDLACWSCPRCSQALASPTAANPQATCGLTNGDGCTFKPSASIAGLTCLEGGDVQGVGDPDSIFYVADIADYPYQSSAEQCAAVCAQLDDCVSSTHDWKTNTCIFSPFTTTSSGFSDSRWNYGAWSDQACFSCPICDSGSSTTTTTDPEGGGPGEPGQT
ncbi:hypothetical protein B0J13DRAFT_651617 [Dactylonectria estremocensis]|uniref:Apple domain-containing protein n=1 Tax=Dactylonectria estremocensis TaxID=1079267 RepID=A0A9P9DG43_9HYPO|nr:hypothetical protein B0J13DRAFT_651617 [Dactylonectria estremocensis]